MQHNHASQKKIAIANVATQKKLHKMSVGGQPLDMDMLVCTDNKTKTAIRLSLSITRICRKLRTLGNDKMLRLQPPSRNFRAILGDSVNNCISHISRIHEANNQKRVTTGLLSGCSSSFCRVLKKATRHPSRLLAATPVCKGPSKLTLNNFSTDSGRASAPYKRWRW